MVLGPTNQAVGRLLEEEEDDEIAVLLISIPDSDGPLQQCWDSLWVTDLFSNTVSYIQAFDGLEAFKMYYMIGASVSSLHRESTNSTEKAPGAPSGIVVSDVESTSVRVSWQAVENADRYTVTLSQTMGDDQLGLCREDSHTLSVDTSSLSVVVGQTDDDMLRAYTTYSITVAAINKVLGKNQCSGPILVTTTTQKGKQ